MFFIPLYDEIISKRRPTITWLIITICVLVFFWQLSLDAKTSQLALYQFGFVPAIVFNEESLPAGLSILHPWFTVFSSMFLHGGWIHLGSNVLYLWVFGDNVEDSMGPTKFVCFYLLCGTAATFTHAMIDTSSTVPLVGASGGIAGIIGAYLMLYPKAAVRCLLVIVIFISFTNLPAWLVLGFWIVGQFVALPLALDSGGGGIAYLAHIGGFFAGVTLIAFFKDKNLHFFSNNNRSTTPTGRRISYAEVKANAQQRFGPKNGIKSSVLVPSTKKRSQQEGPWN